MSNYDVPYWATLPVSAVVCAGVGFLIGLPALRLGGLYLALTTFALAVAMPQMLKHKALEDLDRRRAGAGDRQAGRAVRSGLTSRPVAVPVHAWRSACVLYLLAWNLVRGRIGRAMMAIRDHALAAEAMGINIAMLKTRTFAVSAMYTGIAGSLGAIVVAFVAPDSFSFLLSITLFVGLVVGGVASIGGTIVGAFFVEFVPNWAGDLSKAAPGAIYGVLLIAMLFLMPPGAGGFLHAMWRRLARR